MFELSFYNKVRELIVSCISDKNSFINKYYNSSSCTPIHEPFSRNTKFCLVNMLSFMIMPRAASTTVELIKFAQLTHSPLVTKQAFFMKRRLISAELFEDILKGITSEFYYYGKEGLATYKGRYILAVDSSILTLPDTPEMRELYGREGRRKSAPGNPSLRIVVVRDVLNGMIVGVKIAPLSESEQFMAVDLIRQLPEYLTHNSIFVFDRGYFGSVLFTTLHNLGLQYVSRLPRGFNKDVDCFFRSMDAQRDIRLAMSDVNWKRKASKSYERAGIAPESAPQIYLHLYRYKLISDETEVLATRIFSDAFTASDIYRIYGLRWRVEISLDELKNELQLEIFSGYTNLAIRQDILCKIIAYNIGITLAAAANQRLAKKHGGICNTKVNLNIAWLILKPALASLLLIPPGHIRPLLYRIIEELCRSKITIRPGRHNPHIKRIRNINGKYVTYTNYKRSI